ncbi:DNA cytosine methyltransferase [Budvicia diplopodorum]|uniref:DNA cytosine methyltransferase n=1 Tax=Budvicia diplopodorum TaxID=1119056 RepID=UPI00135AC6C0|nr:DNA (cytosine-5-)-methyltransferase [Budvicia diplopodorum]
MLLDHTNAVNDYAGLITESPVTRPSFDNRKPAFLEFFAGSGLVAHALRTHFRAVWANDISEKKAKVYKENHQGKQFLLGSISDVKGRELPEAMLSWASFPCQDLSLAGTMAGIHAKRSGLVWEWLRVMDEMVIKPPVLVAENVTGLVSVDNGNHYRLLHKALVQRGYRVGALRLDAVRWLPQSRPRIFVVAVQSSVKVPQNLIASEPNWAHSSALQSVAKGLESWIWWNLPEPKSRKENLADIIEWDAECDPPEIATRNLSMVPEAHFVKLRQDGFVVAPGYKRIRNKKQVLELRFDGIAGCLRTPKGGSSRQFLVLKKNGELKTRLLTIRETARLMGAPESFELPGSYNDGYMAMGDAVAAPVARHLAKYLLSPLVLAVQKL